MCNYNIIDRVYKSITAKLYITKFCFFPHFILVVMVYSSDHSMYVFFNKYIILVNHIIAFFCVSLFLNFSTTLLFLTEAINSKMRKSHLLAQNVGLETRIITI